MAKRKKKDKDDGLAEVMRLLEHLGRSSDDDQESPGIQRQITDRESALSFLRDHQPMPDEDTLTIEESDLYTDVIGYFVDHPDPEGLRLLVSSIPERANAYVCESIRGVMAAVDRQTAEDTLVEALGSGSPGVTERATRYALDYPSVRYLGPLTSLLQAPAPDEESVAQAVYVLEAIQEDCDSAEASEALAGYNADPGWDGLRTRQAEWQRKADGFREQWRMKRAMEQATKLFRDKSYQGVVGLLEPYEDGLPAVARKKLELARKCTKPRSD